LLRVDTFNAFDKDGNAELGYPEYVEAWKFLGQPGTERQIKQAFDSVDVDGSGLVDRDEFVFSIMGEKAMKYGTLADMEKLERLLDVTMKEYMILKDTLSEARVDNESRSKRNAQLRERLNNMKSDVQDQIGSLMTDLLGLRPEDVLSDEEIRQHLTDAFNKFDEDNSGEMGAWEFKQAWFFLGLKGTQIELDEAFAKVDANQSGLIDLDEFITAIRSERLMELNLKKVFDKLGVKVEGVNRTFEAFQKTVKRRRLLKKKMEDSIERATKSIISKLLSLNKRKIPERNPEKQKL
jgi:Ca2+-binding EF-hand superfamily protein